MNLELWFPQPIWFKDYDTDFSKAVEYIQKLKVTDPGRQISNIGGWQSNDVDFSSTEELKEVFNVITEGVQQVADSLQENGFRGFKLSSSWINVNKGTDFNREHTHPGSTFSGCLYLKVADTSGAIEFTRPDNMSLYPQTGNKTGIFFASAKYKPVVGRLIIFPAWLPHMVMPSESDEERISIAFNVNHIGN
jgi:uncharacterized protein (TIGR02466 family)